MTIARARILVCHPATVSVRRTPARARACVSELAREFPTVAFDLESIAADAATPLASIDLRRWSDRRNDVGPFDAHVEDLARRGPVTLVIRGEADEAVRAAGEMLTRWQRLIGRRNEASSSPPFDRLLARFEALHDMRKPLVRADWNHALDTWQWLLRLRPDAGAALQLAALLHDVERLASEADARIEHLAANYESFKQRHAAEGSRRARTLVEACGFDEATAQRVTELVAGHERPDGDPERAALNDADALSFFSQNSAGYLDYFGAEAMRRKIAYSVRRMRPGAVARIGAVRLRADVLRIAEEVLGAAAPASPAQRRPEAADDTREQVPA